MFGYEAVATQLEEKIKQLTDPFAKIQEKDSNGNPIFDDDGQPVMIPDPTFIIKKVNTGKPNKISFFEGSVCLLLFADVDNIKYNSIGNQGRTAVIQGAVLTFIKGTDRKAWLKCLHYSDIIGDFFENPTALEMPGTTIQPLPNMSQGWRVMDLNKFMDIKSAQLNMATTATTVFQINKNRIRV